MGMIYAIIKRLRLMNPLPSSSCLVSLPWSSLILIYSHQSGQKRMKNRQTYFLVTTARSTHSISSHISLSENRSSSPWQVTTAQPQLRSLETIVKNLHYLEVSAAIVKLFYMSSVFKSQSYKQTTANKDNVMDQDFGFCFVLFWWKNTVYRQK